MSLENMYHLWRRVIPKIYTLLLSPCFYSIGKKSVIMPPFRFSNLNQIQLGKDVTVHGYCWIQAVSNKIVTDEVPKLVIKDNAAIGMNATISAAKQIIIEEYVFTARNVYISDHGHKYDDISIPIALQSITKIAEVKIGAHTWLGQNAVVMPGVTIGRHCVVGANSVVTKDMPDYSVAVGIPARIIKHYDPVTGSWVEN